MTTYIDYVYYAALLLPGTRRGFTIIHAIRFPTEIERYTHIHAVVQEFDLPCCTVAAYLVN